MVVAFRWIKRAQVVKGTLAVTAAVRHRGGDLAALLGVKDGFDSEKGDVALPRALVVDACTAAWVLAKARFGFDLLEY